LLLIPLHQKGAFPRLSNLETQKLEKLSPPRAAGSNFAAGWARKAK
jgi:hypothetical protein